MIKFLYGEDTYRSRQYLKKIIQDYKKNSNWSEFIFIDINDKEKDFLIEVSKYINTISMFSEGKLIVIQNIFLADKEVQEKLIEILESGKLEKDKNIIIVFWDEKPDTRIKLFKFLQKKSEFKEYKFLKDNQLKKWIKNYVDEARGKIDDQSIDLLIQYIGSDLWRISSEINKLINYSKIIKKENIELLVNPDFDLNIFSMVDALGQKNKKRALDLFKKHLDKGVDEFYLLSMFVYQFRNLLKFKSGGKLKLHPFVLRKTQQQARNFSFEDLKKIYHNLLMIDIDSKTGKKDIKIALDLFVAKL